MTPDTQGIDNLTAYPNPFNPGEDPVLYFGFTVKQKDCDSIGIKIYTSALRKIRDEKMGGADKDAAINNARIGLQSYKLGDIAGGAYYYYIYTEKQGIITKSKTGILLIVR
jgi:hypothetical protein